MSPKPKRTRPACADGKRSPNDGAKKYSIKAIRKAIDGSGGLKSNIARRLGCSRTTLQRYIDENPELIQAMSEEKDQVGDLCESKLIQAIKEDNLTAIIFYSKTQMKDRGYIEDSNVRIGAIEPAPTAASVRKASLEIFGKLKESGAI